MRIARVNHRVRQRWIVVPVFIIAALLTRLALAVVTDAGHAEVPTKVDGTPLSFLVNEFNRKAAEDRIGHDEPKLTEDEVAGAIYAATLHGHEIPKDAAAIYRKIADTRKLPAGTILSFTTRWVMTGQAEFRVWWIDLHIDRGKGKSYVQRIRERILSGHLTPDKGVRLEIKK